MDNEPNPPGEDKPYQVTMKKAKSNMISTFSSSARDDLTLTSPPSSSNSTAYSSDISPAKRKITFSPQSKLRAGNKNALHFHRWTEEMISCINNLLAEYIEEPSKYEKVLKEYTKLVHKSLVKDNTGTKLFPTSTRFIQMYDNDLNR